MLSSLNSSDTLWVFFCTVLVFVMVVGLGFFYEGLSDRPKALSILTLCFTAACIVSLQWVLFGYSLAFGPDHNGWIGTLAWAALGEVGTEPNLEYAGTVPHLAFMIFQGMAAMLAIVILLGAFARRVRFGAACLLTLLWTTLVFDPVAHWIVGMGGFLRRTGVLDFSGGTVVFLTAAVSALAMAVVLGRPPSEDQPETSPASPTFAVLGAALFWCGGFGFVSGHAFISCSTAASAMAATQTAAVSAGLTWMIFDRIFYKHISLIGLLSGAIVGIVAIAPVADAAGLWKALGLGISSSILAYGSFILTEKKFGYGQALFPVCIFGIGSLAGILSAGPLLIQTKAILAISLYSFCVSFLLFKGMDYLVGLCAD